MIKKSQACTPSSAITPGWEVIYGYMWKIK